MNNGGKVPLVSLLNILHIFFLHFDQEQWLSRPESFHMA